MKRWIIAITIAVAPLSAHAAVPIERQGSSPSPLVRIEATALVVLDKETGAELLSRSPDSPWPIASITKLLSAITRLDAKPNLDRLVIMQRSDEVGGARLRNVRPGVRFRSRDLLAAGLIGSANNAIQALARVSGPGVKTFVSKMNKTARGIGLKQTAVYDPTGLNPRNVATGRDLAHLIRRAYAIPQIKNLLESETYTINPVGRGTVRTIKNTNKLVGATNGYHIAGKTGFIDESKYNFAAVADDDLGHPLVVVLLGNSSSAQNFEDTRALAEWVWANFEWQVTP